MRRFLWGALVALCVSCAGTTARHDVLLPALARAWPGVREDALHGAARMPEPDAAREAVAAAGDAVERRDGARLLGVWRVVRDAATAGIGRREADGEVGRYGAEVLRERIVQFGRAVDALANAPGVLR